MLSVRIRKRVGKKRQGQEKKRKERPDIEKPSERKPYWERSPKKQQHNEKR